MNNPTEPENPTAFPSAAHDGMTDMQPLDPGIEGWTPTFSNREFFKRLDREVIREINELRIAMAKFDSYRHAWAEIVANNVKPGRNSQFRERLEEMQGDALRDLHSAAHRLGIRIWGSEVTNERSKP